MTTTQKLSPATRISIRLSPQARVVVEEIMKLADSRTIQDAVKRALGDELFLLRETKLKGSKVLLQRGNEYREVFWP